MLGSSSSTKYLMLVTLLILLFQAILIETEPTAGEEPNVERYELDLLEDDVFTVYISPPVESLSARCSPLSGSGTYDLSLSTKYVDRYVTLETEVSAVWVQPAEPGIYNLTVSFVANKTWEYIVGVYARSLGFYRKYYGDKVTMKNFFIKLYGPFSRRSGNWTINIIMKIYSSSQSPNLITLPTPINSAIFIAALGLIAYIDAFALLDTYFKSKNEVISYSRWAIVGIVLLISAYIAYQIYGFTIFTPSGRS